MKALFPKLERNTGCFVEDKGRETATQRKIKTRMENGEEKKRMGRERDCTGGGTCDLSWPRSPVTQCDLMRLKSFALQETLG